MKSQIWVVLVVFFMLVAPAWADEMVSVKLGYQLLAPSGQFSGDSFGDTVIDMEDDLNFDDSEEVTAELALNLGNSRFSLGYMPIKTSGSGTGLNLIFNGQTFTGDVNGKVDADLYDLGYTYYIINTDDLPVRLQLGLEVAVKVFDGEASVSGLVGATSITETVSGTVPIPTLGGRARIALSDFVGIVARAGYMEYSGNSFLDAEAQLEFSPIPLVGIYGGYRILDIDVDEFDGVLDAEFAGLFAGAFIRF